MSIRSPYLDAAMTRREASMEVSPGDPDNHCRRPTVDEPRKEAASFGSGSRERQLAMAHVLSILYPCLPRADLKGSIVIHICPLTVKNKKLRATSIAASTSVCWYKHYDARDTL